jgi:hypothetical protein
MLTGSPHRVNAALAMAPYLEAGSHWCRQAAQDATRLTPETDEWGWRASPHAGHGPGASGCQGLLHPQENPAGPLSRTGIIG